MTVPSPPIKAIAVPHTFFSCSGDNFFARRKTSANVNALAIPEAKPSRLLAADILLYAPVSTELKKMTKFQAPKKAKPKF
jgi:hypothetical protein